MKETEFVTFLKTYLPKSCTVESVDAKDYPEQIEEKDRHRPVVRISKGDLYMLQFDDEVYEEHVMGWLREDIIAAFTQAESQ